MSAAGEKVVQVAEEEVGYRESGENLTKYGEHYGMNGVPWCALFVTWCFEAAGCALPEVYAYCPRGAQLAETTRQLTNTPAPGDIVIFDFIGNNHAPEDVGPEHTGIFLAEEGDYIRTIEGNSVPADGNEGEEVGRRLRHKSSVYCYWRPAALGTTDGGTVRPHPAIGTLEPLVLKQGVTSPAVLAVQRFLRLAARLLKEPGLECTDIDGQYGPRTAAGVRLWQLRVGADPDGEWGPQTMAASHRYVRQIVPDAELARGSSGPAVMAVQRFLFRVSEVLSLSSADPKGVDGHYGANTASAVAALERHFALDIDGRWTPSDLDAAVSYFERIGVLGSGAASSNTTANPRGELRMATFKGDAILRACAAGTGTLAAGTKGEVVRRVQMALLLLGHTLPRYGADGDYGQETATAVMAFQKSRGLVETGVIDQATILALDEALVAGQQKATTTEVTARETGLSAGFYDGLVKTADRIGCAPEALLAIMMSECSLNPSAVNTASGAVGLIQFMPETLVWLGWTAGPDAFAKLPAERQLPFVEAFFTPWKAYGLNTLGRLYQAVLLPASLERTDGHVYSNDPNDPYHSYFAANQGLDHDNDGVVTTRDLENHLRAKSTGPAWEAALSRLHAAQTSR